jgi:hypothetical protein
MQRVAVCWCAAAQRVLHAGQAPSSMCLSDSAALSRSRAFPARPAHRPACIKTADLADRWARMRVDTNDENRALSDISIHESPATSKPAQTATLLSRGEAPEAEIDTRRLASPVALARTLHFGHHQCPLVTEFPTLEAAWGRAGRCGAGRLRAWSGGAEFGRSALICAEQSGGIACHSIRRPNPAEMCGRLPACRPGRGPASRISAFRAENFGAPPVLLPWFANLGYVLANA